jgi:hypothetical protein
VIQFLRLILSAADSKWDILEQAESEHQRVYSQRNNKLTLDQQQVFSRPATAADARDRWSLNLFDGPVMQ